MRAPGFFRLIHCVVVIAAAAWTVSAAPGRAAAQDPQLAIAERADRLLNSRRFREAQELAEREYKAASARNDSINRVHWGRVLAKADFELGRVDRAEGLIKQYIASFTENPRMRKYVAGAMVDLGDVYTRLARFDEAEATIVKGLRLLEQSVGPEDQMVGHALDSLGTNFSARGQYGQAEPKLRQAIDVYRKAQGPAHATTLTTMLNLADVYGLQNRKSDELAIAREVVAICRKFGKTNDAIMIEGLEKLGALELEARSFDAAEKLYKEALEISIKFDGDGTRQVAQLCVSLALVALNTDRPEESEKLFKRSLAIYEKACGPEHPSVAGVLLHLARLTFDMRQQPDEAYRMMDRCVQIYERTGAWPDQLFKAYVERVGYRSMTGRWDQKSIDDVRAAMDLAEAQRGRSGGGSLERAGYFASFNMAFGLMVGLQIELGDKGDPGEAFSAMERFHARVLLEQMAVGGGNRDAGRTQGERDALNKRETELTLAVNRLQDRLADETDPARREMVIKELMVARARLNDHYRQADATSPLFRKVINRVPTLADVRRELLQPGDMLCEYIVTSLAGEALIATRDSAKIYHMTFNDEEAKIMGVDPGYLDTDRARRAFFKADGTGLFQQLANPKSPVPADKLRVMWNTVLAVPEVQKAVTDGTIKRLFVIPDGPLALLPFEALVINDSPNPEYLLDKGPEIVYAPSSSVLLTLAGRSAAQVPQDREPVLTVGDPAYGGERVLSNAPIDRQAARSPRELYRAAAGRLSRLPFAGVEARQISETFNAAGMKCTLLTGGAATEGAVRNAIGGRRILHFACHGVAEEGYGNLFGALAFAPGPKGDTDPRDDGFLTLNEISSLDLKTTELAILSACETNFGADQEGEGTMALTRGFLVAGVRRALTSNWLVDDKAAATLVTGYCGRLSASMKSGSTPDYGAALREAKRQVRRMNGWDKPYYWAGLVLVGPP